MKILFLVVGLLVMVGSLFAGGFLGADLAGDDTGLLLLEMLPLALLGIEPVMVGSIVAQWPVDPREAQGRPYFVRLVLVVASVTVVCVLVLEVFFARTGAPLGLSVAVGVGSAALVAAAAPIGEWLRRRDAAHPRPEVVFEGMSRAQLRAKVRRIIVWSIVVFVVTAIAGEVVLGLSAGKHDSAGQTLARAIGFGVSFGALAGMLTTLTITLPLSRALRDSLGTDLALRKAIVRAVVKVLPQDLDGEAEQRAARYAAIARVQMPFTLGQSLLLFVSLAAQRLVSLTDSSDDLDAFSIGLLAFIVVVVAIAVPLSVRNLRRVRRYSDAHPVRATETAA